MHPFNRNRFACSITIQKCFRKLSTNERVEESPALPTNTYVKNTTSLLSYPMNETPLHYEVKQLIAKQLQQTKTLNIVSACNHTGKFWTCRVFHNKNNF